MYSLTWCTCSNCEHLDLLPAFRHTHFLGFFQSCFSMFTINWIISPFQTRKLRLRKKEGLWSSLSIFKCIRITLGTCQKQSPGPNPQRFWVSRYKMEPRNLHFNVPRFWGSWSTEPGQGLAPSWSSAQRLPQARSLAYCRAWYPLEVVSGFWFHT